MLRTSKKKLIGLMMLALCSSLLVSCRRAVTTTTEVVAVNAATVPTVPNDTSWDNAPEHVGKLLLQDLVEPRQMKATTAEVHVRAITNGSEMAFRLEWADATKSDKPMPAQFLDGCAVQVPVKLEANLPAPQMGEPGKPVEITFWRADWQATLDGRPDSIKELHPNAAIDHYPFEADSLPKNSAAQQEMATRYAPAQAVGNRRVGPRNVPVEDMLAEGPGSLSPAAASSKGKGVKTADGWSVVIVRKVPNGLTTGARTQTAFAIWEGGQNEVGARKMRTGWVPLLMKGQAQ